MLLYFVRCTGTESSLLNCSHNEIDDYYYDYDYYLIYHYCSHYSDAGVVCPSCKLCVWLFGTNTKVLTPELLSQLDWC